MNEKLILVSSLPHPYQHKASRQSLIRCSQLKNFLEVSLSYCDFLQSWVLIILISLAFLNIRVEFWQQQYNWLKPKFAWIIGPCLLHRGRIQVVLHLGVTFTHLKFLEKRECVGVCTDSSVTALIIGSSVSHRWYNWHFELKFLWCGIYEL